MAEYDLVIRAGRVVDGTGVEPSTADIAVTDGRIVEVGRIGSKGHREIDADGLTVAPGFVDVHTHYDGQATWDDYLQPSSWHGVTTVVMGNCGVGFAPVVPEDRTRLVKLMEGVEDIPGVALTEGLSWDWETFPEYMDALERRAHDIDIAAQVPHAALRVRAMGKRAAARERATADEITLMAKLAREAIDAGAVGFSTSRTLNHKSITGELTPSYDAGDDELVAIASAIGDTGTGVMQIVTDIYEDTAPEFALIRRMLEASGRPMSISLVQINERPERYRKILDFLDEMNAAGHRLRGQVAARGIGVILGLECTLHPFMLNPVWKQISHLSVREQAERMADPDFKRQMLAAQTGDKDPNLIGGDFIDLYDRMFYLADPPDYEPALETSIAQQATASGRTPEDIAYDIVVSDDGRGKLYEPLLNYGHGSLDAVREMLTHRYTIPGLSDGGAHVGTICDGSFPTTLMQYWARDREYGRLELPFVIARQARATAEAVGLNDRGYIRPGYKADINVLDIDGMHLYRPTVHYDFPAGGRRLLQRADGYQHTFVSGVETYHLGEATGALPGRLIRGAREAQG